MPNAGGALSPVPRTAPARATPALLAGAGGLLYCLGYVGVGVWPCLLIFLVPLWITLERAPSYSAAIALGAAFGATAYAAGFTWLWKLVPIFLAGRDGVGALLWLAYGGWFAAGFAVYAAAFHRLRAGGWPLAMAGVPPLLAIEWLQPQLFPVHAGGGLVAVPVWMQSADLGGPLLLTALVGGANVAAYVTIAWARGEHHRPLAAWAVALTIAVASYGYGRMRLAGVDATVAHAPALRVGVVQANLGVLEKRTQSVVAHQRHLELTRALLAEGPLDLIVWPETAYGRGLRRPLPISGSLVREDLTVPILFGATSVWQDDDGRRLRTNSAFLIDGDGTIRDAYDKNLLIPFAEYLPFARWVPGLADWFPHVEEFAAATDAPPLHLGPWRIATPICYEAVRPAFVRDMVRQGQPHLLVSLANDAWFGDSQEPWIHLALARLRAVEHRRFLIRATNSGVSAIVDPAGRVVARTDVLAQATLRGVVTPLDGETLYDRIGDWPGWLATGLVLVGLAVRAPRRGVAG